MKHLTSILLVLLFHATSLMAKPSEIPPELIGRHSGAMGQQGQGVKDGVIRYGEGRIGLGGVEIEKDGDLIVPFAVGSNEVKNRTFKFNNYENGVSACWHPLQDGEDRYSADLFRYGSVFRILVKLHRKDGSVSVYQWVCAEPQELEQSGNAGVKKKSPEFATSLLKSEPTASEPHLNLSLALVETKENEFVVRVLLENLGTTTVRVLAPEFDFYRFGAYTEIGGYDLSFLAQDGKAANIDWGEPPLRGFKKFPQEEDTVALKPGMGVAYRVSIAGELADQSKVSSIVARYYLHGPNKESQEKTGGGSVLVGLGEPPLWQGGVVTSRALAFETKIVASLLVCEWLPLL